MSVERAVRRSLRGIVFWRLLGDCLSLPRFLLVAAADWLLQIERGVVYLEFDCARRYKALTGIDLALAAGDRTRYAMLDPERNERELSAMLDDPWDDE